MNRPDPHAVVREHWSDPVPDWIKTLADQCASTSQAKVSRMIGYSSAVVSTVLRDRYPGNLAKVESAVRTAFMDGKIDCPALGPISGNDCITHQKNASTFKNTRPDRIAMFRACRSCPRNHSNQKGDS
ncbi:MAG: hypothetical protein AAFS03_02380 [Pseudomonadota bacterium]